MNKIFFCMCAVLLGASPGIAAGIKEQRREGTVLIVTRTDGSVETNSLFLAMAPEVKAQIERRKAAEAIVSAIGAITADTRSNIPGTENLSDEQIAVLYLQQMTKNAAALLEAAPTNSVEYVIGAGIRQDIEAAKEATP
jgi:hypothetical protein